MPAQEYQRTVQFQPAQQREQYTPGTAVAPAVLDNPAAQDLMAFSKTLAEAGKDFVQKKREQRDMEMYNKALNSDNPDEVSQEIRGVKDEMDKDYTASNELARAVANDGEPEAAVTLRNLTGRDRWYYAKGLAEKVAQRHLGWSQQQMADPNRVFAGGPNGTFTASDAARDPILQQVAMKQLRMELLKTHGIENMKPEFFNEWAGKTIRQNEAKLIQQARTAKINYDGAQAREVAVSTFQQEVLSDPQKALANLFTNMQAARNARGNFMSPNEIWTDASNTIIELAQNGQVDIAVLEDLKKAPIPNDPKGRTYGDLYGARFTDLTNDVNQAQRTRYNNQKSDDTMQARDAYNRYLAQVRENPELADPRAIQQAKTNLIVDQKLPADVVNSVWGNVEEAAAAYSPDRDKHLQEVAELETIKAGGNIILPLHLEGRTDETKRKYAREAQENFKTEAGFDVAEKAARALSKTGVTPISDGEYDYTNVLMQAHLVDKVKQYFNELYATGKYDGNESGAMDDALRRLEKEFLDGQKNPESPYFQNASAGGRYDKFISMTVGPIQNQIRNINEITKSRLTTMQDVGNRIFEIPNRFFEKSDIEKLQKYAEKDPLLTNISPSDPLYVKVATARFVAQKTNTTLPNIIKRQSNALGMGFVDTQQIFNESMGRYNSKTQGLVNRITNATASQRDVQEFNFTVNREALAPFRSQVSSVTFEKEDGEGGLDIFFEDKKFPVVMNGKVKDIGFEPGYGHYVVVESIDEETGTPMDLLYSHLAQETPLKKGQQVFAGNLVGTQGGTGRVVSYDGTIASIDVLTAEEEGSTSMTKHPNHINIRRRIAQSLGYRGN